MVAKARGIARQAQGRPRRHARPRRHRRAAARRRQRPPGCCGSSPAAGKTYTGEVVLGRRDLTLDAAGEVTATHDMAGVTLDDVRRAAADALTGDIHQVPPMVSAIKVGRPAAARAGPGGHRGRAGAAPGDRAPLRRRRDGRPARCLPHRGRRARRAPTSARWPPTSAPPSAAAPTSATCGAPPSARSPWPTPGRWTTSTALLPAGGGPARPADRRPSTRRGGRVATAGC